MCGSQLKLWCVDIFPSKKTWPCQVRMCSGSRLCTGAILGMSAQGTVRVRVHEWAGGRGIQAQRYHGFTLPTTKKTLQL